jgi:hypothetical protein
MAAGWVGEEGWRRWQHCLLPWQLLDPLLEGPTGCNLGRQHTAHDNVGRGRRDTEGVWGLEGREGVCWLRNCPLDCRTRL